MRGYLLLGVLVLILTACAAPGSTPTPPRVTRTPFPADHFWFSWAAFRPETRVYRTDQPVAAPPSTAPEGTSARKLANRV
jgi:hypothetical protein